MSVLGLYCLWLLLWGWLDGLGKVLVVLLLVVYLLGCICEVVYWVGLGFGDGLVDCGVEVLVYCGFEVVWYMVVESMKLFLDIGLLMFLLVLLVVVVVLGVVFGIGIFICVVWLVWVCC